jgi:hypothetical protein
VAFRCRFFLEVVVEDDAESVAAAFWVIAEDFRFEGVELVAEDCGEAAVRRALRRGESELPPWNMKLLRSRRSRKVAGVPVDEFSSDMMSSRRE